MWRKLVSVYKRTIYIHVCEMKARICNDEFSYLADGLKLVTLHSISTVR